MAVAVDANDLGLITTACPLGPGQLAIVGGTTGAFFFHPMSPLTHGRLAVGSPSFSILPKRIASRGRTRSRYAGTLRSPWYFAEIPR